MIFVKIKATLLRELNLPSSDKFVFLRVCISFAIFFFTGCSCSLRVQNVLDLFD